GEDLAYAFVVDSAATAFRGTATYEDHTLVLAGRHGRGGLRHDNIPLHRSVADALSAGRQVDRVVVADDWADPVPDTDARVVRLDEIPDPVSDTVDRLAAALGRVAPVRHL